MHSSVDIQGTSQALSLEQDTAAAAQEDLLNRRTLLNVRNLIPEEDTEVSEEDTDDPQSRTQCLRHCLKWILKK